MTPSLARVEVRRLALVALAALGQGALLLAGCEGPGPAPAAGDDRAALVAVSVSLPPPAQWRLLTADGETLVSPRWSPDGRLVLARGPRGVGLFVLGEAAGEVVHAEEGFEGLAFFEPGGALCAGPRRGLRGLRLDPSRQSPAEAAAGCAAPLVDERLGERLSSTAEGEVFLNALRGTVTRVSPLGEEVELESHGAWAAAVSADGRRVAWCVGSIAESELLVNDPATGTRRLGAGVHPAWSPRGDHLVFAAPRVYDDDETGARSYESDLWVHDVARNASARLTDTPSIAELQPSVSPDGHALLIADWEGDVVYEAPVAGLEGAGGQP